ncbi:hypothetical protein KC19_VG118500 [Ceratodon purpureus]|uniref:NADH dehydrogenase subunit 4L n=1 Tax=Ceratodon purpureus TaxID=3225 RepID=A0A8T0HPH9_CERPU|nr:hypothetical protein KC19_VG118500 [Ceratodon purpureus]
MSFLYSIVMIVYTLAHLNVSCSNSLMIGKTSAHNFRIVVLYVLYRTIMFRP